jgi:hypothetical protein
VSIRSLRPGGAEFGALVFLVSLFALYGNVVPFGWSGFLLGAAIGVLWGLTLLAFVRALERGVARARIAADATLVVCAAGLASVAAAGLLYMLVFDGVLDEPTATHAVLSAMMAPTVPYFIVLNGILEMLVVPLALALNLDGSLRGILVGAAAFLYWLMRAWTYAIFAEPRMTMGSATLSDADVALFRETLASDQRVYMAALAALLLALAALQRPLRRSEAG